MNDACNSMVTPIKSIMLKHPREAFVSQAYLEEVWQDFGYSSCPDFEKALKGAGDPTCLTCPILRQET